MKPQGQPETYSDLFTVLNSLILPITRYQDSGHTEPGDKLVDDDNVVDQVQLQRRTCARDGFEPGTLLVVDESVLEYSGGDMRVLGTDKLYPWEAVPLRPRNARCSDEADQNERLATDKR